MQEVAFYLSLVAAVLAVVSVGVSLLVLRQSPFELQRELAELHDRVEHWMRRDRVRKVREGQDRALDAAEGAETQTPTPTDLRTRKAQLRARFLGGS